MKRREFLICVSKYLTIAGIGLPLMYETLQEGSTKSASYGGFDLLNESYTIKLPDEPEEYISMIDLRLTSRDVPRKLVSNDNIHGESEDFIITKPGSYSIQYLGPYYGWNIV